MSHAAFRLLPVVVLLSALIPNCSSSPLASFRGHLNCPFAHLWVAHGPQRAAHLLGLPQSPSLENGDGVLGLRRQLLQGKVTDSYASCTYTNPFSGQATCMEFRGSEWVEESARQRCSNVIPQASGSLELGGVCSLPEGELQAGWCISADGAEATIMSAPTPESCGMVKSACESWSSGTFLGMGVCNQAGGTNMTLQTTGPQMCTIAPGPIGGAHQLGQSPGYTNDCEGTPAQQSPYMWPLRWTAMEESRSMGFGSDEVTYQSKGQVWYFLDRNWKRSDLTYQNGTQWTVGQRPCDPENQVGPNKCLRFSDQTTTMLHRGPHMYFLDYAPGSSSVSDIVSCTWLDLSVVGNVRPDWFLDDRGASSDVQYIGDSHVYYEGRPTLVKQWRKQDFANQYFTMSMKRNAAADGVHWPLILNVPGEGFGDDFLKHYSSHRQLTDEDEALFLIDQQFEKAGGKCVKMERDGTDGPPTGETQPIPSNLEKEDVSWRSIVHTESPVWVPEETEAKDNIGVYELEDGITAKPCVRDGSKLELELTVAAQSPVWAAIGFRETEECLMTPRGGLDGEVVMAQPHEAGSYSVSYGPLPPTLKQFSADHSDFLAGLGELDSVEGFSSGTAEFQDGKLTISFVRDYFPFLPEELHLSFAHGDSPELGYHSSRGCFKLTDLPSCDSQTVAFAMDSNPNGCPTCHCTDSSGRISGRTAFWLVLAPAIVLLSWLLF